MRRALLLLMFMPLLMGQDYNVPFRPVAAGGGGSQSQVLPSWIDPDLPTTATTTWLPISGSKTGASEEAVSMVMPHDADFTKIRLQLASDIGTAGDNAILTLRENGADTALACTISGGAGSEVECTGTGTVTIEAGNLAALSLVTQDTPNAVEYRFALQLTENTTAGRSAIFSTFANIAAASTRYAGFSGNSGTSTTQANHQSVIPIAGTVRDLRIDMDAAPGGSSSRTFTVYKNTSTTVLSCVVSASATTCSDIDSFTVAAGDRISIEDVPASSPSTTTLTHASVTFDATAASKFVVIGKTQTDTLRASGADYSPPNCLDCVTTYWFGAIANRRAVSEAFTMTDLAAFSEDAGPYTTNVIPTVNGSDQTDLTCAVSAGVSCVDTGSVAVGAGQTLEFHWDVTTGGGNWTDSFAGTVP